MMMTSLRPPTRFVRLNAYGLLALLFASSSACSSSGADSAKTEPEPEIAFEGVWRAWPEGHSAFDVHIDGDRARVVRFGPGFEIGNPEVMNGGDPLMTDLTRVDARTFSARVARIDYGSAPTYPNSWPTAVSYVGATLEWDEGSSRWIVDVPALELSRQSATFDGEYAPAGACEKKFENNTGATLYVCEYPQDADGCSSGGEKAFWPSTDCERLGYAFHSDDLGEYWYESETSNVTPGARGQWGNGRGGTKFVSEAAAATGGGDDPPGGEMGVAIASCSDRWVCTEILTGDSAAFQAECEKGGDTPSASGCPPKYKGSGGPECLNASFTSIGSPVTGNFYWTLDFCANNPNIDTEGTCRFDVDGEPGDLSKHCQAP